MIETVAAVFLAVLIENRVEEVISFVKNRKN